VRGEVRIKSYTDDPMSLASYAPLTSEDGATSFRIVSARPHQNGMIVARLDGVNDRAAAEALARVRIYAPREALGAELADDEFMQSDLVGLGVEDAQGRRVGEIAGVENYGAGDLLAIALADRGRIALLPFTDAFVPTVAIHKGRVVIDPPQGWDEA